MTPGRAKSQPPQIEPYGIPYNTEVRPPLPHPYDGSTYNVPLVHRYNTRSRRLKFHNLMANHVEKFTPPRQPPTLSPAYTVHIIGEDRDHTKKTTGEVTIHPGKTNGSFSQRLEIPRVKTLDEGY